MILIQLKLMNPKILKVHQFIKMCLFLYLATIFSFNYLFYDININTI